MEYRSVFPSRCKGLQRGVAQPPGARGIWTTERRAPLQINSLGLRDVERKLAKPAGTLRIGLLGDSMVEGA
jgi:hypothetical protein